MKDIKIRCAIPRGAHGATHQEWAYRREAIIWFDDKPIKPNLVPYAREMSLWTQQKTISLPLHTKLEQDTSDEISNPYTYSLSAISQSISAIINDAFNFAGSIEPMHPIDAEIKRIRFESELTIYAARFCEAAIKQMLYCTQFPEKMYKTASMGKLLAHECEDCKKNERERHDISMLGSLAHRFYLCHILDDCAIDHLQLVARRRNLEAAHSESQSINPRSASESRSHLSRSIYEIGYDLGHMADHIGAIEDMIIKETELYIRRYPSTPSNDELLQIPVRYINQYTKK
ncbi:hypothetical protein GBN24_07960 [Plesiomonas shigelloides]|uniref:hypothetical protein n=1 Tax=Plesiomonas shigelloides TaxID=703 RepID=UPI001261BCE2|nr:hypothetical protein [Plesiomonas shigelloides]KAB7690751.1 hypothetical protein GBN24_07960 [Plesiomonas shigelloides]